MPPLTRGPLPARVYWVRRTLVIAVALLLILAIARLLGDGSDAADPKADAAATVAAPMSGSPTSASTGPPSPAASATTGATAGGTRQGSLGSVGSLAPLAPSTASATPILAAPQGSCADDDVSVTPEVPRAVGGRDVRIVLLLRTMTSEACTWHTDRNAVSVDITSGKDQIWSSRQCPRAIPVRDVVVRKNATSRLSVVWNARRSDDTCSGRTAWALPGFYHVTAAAVGAEPADAQFELTRPARPTIVRTASPSPSATRSPSRTPQVQPSGRPVAHPSPSR